VITRADLAVRGIDDDHVVPNNDVAIAFDLRYLRDDSLREIEEFDISGNVGAKRTRTSACGSFGTLA
jgi:hypothetical protein